MLPQAPAQGRLAMLKSSLVGTEKSLKSLLRMDHRRSSTAPAEPVSSEHGSRHLKPMPLLEMASMAPPSLSYRSVVTHAVLGSGPLELLLLPTELLHFSFSALDSAALCQLAQVSIGCRQLADDPLVWHAVCGHGKEYERAWSLSLQARRREAEQRREAERKQYARMWKRRVVGVVQALCGLALVLLPLLLLRRVEQHTAFGPVILDAPVPPPPAELRAATAAAAAAAPLRYEHVVWSSLGGACAAPERAPGGQR